MIWFHFRLMKTGFLFFFCGRPSTRDRSHLSCLKVIQCSTSEIGENSCSLPIQVMTTGLIRWAGGRTLCVAAAGLDAGHTPKETKAWLQKECNDLVLFSHSPLSSLDLNPQGLLRLVIRREHHQHDLPQHQSQPDHRHLPSIHSSSSSRRLWKRHALSSGSVSRRWLRLKAATLNRYQLYYIIKLPELIFSINVLK